MITKTELDNLANKYEVPDFIKDDPIQFPHRSQKKEEIELYGFISSLFAYGNRKVFIKKLDEIFSKSENDLINYIKNGDFKALNKINYRFSCDVDIISVFKILSNLYNESKGLEDLFNYAWKNSEHFQDKYDKMKHFLQLVIDYFYSRVPNNVTKGFYHLLPNPANNGAMKRMNMFLRWMVRKGNVDLGIWDFMSPKDLLIPLDVHVGRISRQMLLLNRKSNDFNAVIELTENLLKYSPDDPIKYDFALFGYGIEKGRKV